MTGILTKLLVAAALLTPLSMPGQAAASTPGPSAVPVSTVPATTTGPTSPGSQHIRILRRVGWRSGSLAVAARLGETHLVVRIKGRAPKALPAGTTLKLQRFHPSARDGRGRYGRTLATTRVGSGRHFTMTFRLRRDSRYHHSYTYRLGALAKGLRTLDDNSGWSGVQLALDARPPGVVPDAVAAMCSFAGSEIDFYTAPAVPAGAPGTIIRCQEHPPIPGLTGARAYRVLYLTQAPAPTPQYSAAFVAGVTPLVNRISSGMIFVPDAPAPASGRPVVAWDHGTVGMGDTCAPSRSGFKDLTAVTPGSKPQQSAGFVSNMLANNWVVTATDYAGLGLVGQGTTLQYLVGPSEAMDTANAVRAAIGFPGSGASNQYAVYGQSQGGHAALFSGSINPVYAPELNLRAVAASDPAAQMNALLAQSWNTEVAWVLGPEVVTAWPGVNTALNTPAAAWKILARDQVVSQTGRTLYQDLAGLCIIAAAERTIAIPGSFFSKAIVDPGDQVGAQWRAMADQQTPPVVRMVPTMVGQTTNDGIVLANTTALLQRNWCQAGAPLSMYWVDQGTGGSFLTRVNAHLTSAWTDALAALAFISDGFNATSTAPTTPCTQAPPAGITPYAG